MWYNMDNNNIGIFCSVSSVIQFVYGHKLICSDITRFVRTQVDVYGQESFCTDTGRFVRT